MPRFGKVVFVWAIVFLTAVDPASACRFRRRCCPPPCCYTYVPCCAPVTCCDSSSGDTSGTPEPAAPNTDALPEPTLAPVPEAPIVAPPSLDQPAEVPPPANELPIEDMPEEPAPTPPADDMPDDPAPAPKSGEDVEDLFKDADDKPAADKPADDRLEEPAPAKDEKSEDVEDLFKESDDKKSTSVRPADDASLVQLRAEIEELFDEPAETDANAMRVWTDNTGKHKVFARLVSVGENSVRLLKDTGKFTTVPFSRLSRTDLAFVRQHNNNAIASVK